jgi:2-polyprenyl-3-methyl-5-hydroxy-6-metoxy-1,4-benzoquinol methylase
MPPSLAAWRNVRLPRNVEPEILDRLPADDPRAIRARNDLRWVNTIMAQSRIMARVLRRHQQAGFPRTILDLGSGDGTLMLKVARRIGPRWRDVTVTLLDQHDIVARETRDDFRALGWRAEPVAADVFEFLERSSARFDLITSNLFVHHFEGERLSRLLELVAQRARLFVASEPRRASIGLIFANLIWMLGCDEITRHDATASVHAGFRSKEITELWPDRANWRLEEWAASLFTHGYAAERLETEHDP